MIKVLDLPLQNKPLEVQYQDDEKGTIDFTMLMTDSVPSVDELTGKYLPHH